MSKETEGQVHPEVVEEWLAARAVIRKALTDLFPGTSFARAEQVADAILARLASHSPPILTAHAHRIHYPEEERP